MVKKSVSQSFNLCENTVTGQGPEMAVRDLTVNTSFGMSVMPYTNLNCKHMSVYDQCMNARSYKMILAI